MKKRYTAAKDDIELLPILSLKELQLFGDGVLVLPTCGLASTALLGDVALNNIAFDIWSTRTAPNLQVT